MLKYYLSRLYDIKMIFYPYFIGKIIRQTRDFLLSLAGYRGKGEGDIEGKEEPITLQT